MASCSVCCDSLNRSTRKPVQCGYCDLAVCRACTGRYLLDTALDPHCMGCRKPWNREFLDLNMTKVFVNGLLKAHHSEILFEREKCLLPAAQLELERIDRVREIYKLLENGGEERTRGVLLRELDDIQGARRTAAPVPVKAMQCRKCPTTECRGFLSDWKCSLCNLKTCNKCGETQGDEHVCESGAVETFTLLKNDTKGCPGCGEMIFKISGCSQMWCPSCHTAFDWNTLQIETGRIHNPHYYDFHRKAGTLQREPGDVPCGGRMTIREVMNKFGADEFFMDFHRAARHFEAFDLDGRYRLVPINTLPLRIRYLRGELSEEKFKRFLEQEDKAYKKTAEIRAVIQMFVDTVDGILRDGDNPMYMLTTLRDYFNETMRVIAKRYNSTAPKIIGSGTITYKM